MASIKNMFATSGSEMPFADWQMGSAESCFAVKSQCSRRFTAGYIKFELEECR